MLRLPPVTPAKSDKYSQDIISLRDVPWSRLWKGSPRCRAIDVNSGGSTSRKTDSQPRNFVPVFAQNRRKIKGPGERRFFLSQNDRRSLRSSSRWFRYIKSDEIVTRLYDPPVVDSIDVTKYNYAHRSWLIVKRACRVHSSIGFLYRKQGEQRDTSSPRDFFHLIQCQGN